MPGIFDSKYFNAEVFGAYLDTVPRVKQNAFLNSGALRVRGDLRMMLADQTGGNFVSVPMVGRIGGDPVNYDGNTNITATSLSTYLQSMIVVGRAKGWTERDFAFDITGGHDFMADIAAQVAEYWDDVDQSIILSILKGIFGVTADGFNTKHTLDISGGTGDAANVDATTLNNAMQQAVGANKNIFRLVIMNSAVATNLENLQLLDYVKGTDANGMQRDMSMATWNGRTVLIDDEGTVETAGSGESAVTKYTTYLLGEGCIDYCDCGVKTPNEVSRDPATNGGMDTLYTRQRKLFAPHGFSFVQPTTAIVSPTNAQLETAARWTVVKDTAGTAYYDSKAIPIARIISKG